MKEENEIGQPCMFDKGRKRSRKNQSSAIDNAKDIAPGKEENETGSMRLLFGPESSRNRDRPSSHPNRSGSTFTLS